MSDGVHLMQMIYDPNERLVDCEFLSDPEMVASFEHKFQDDYDAMLQQPTPAAPAAAAANTTTTTFLHLKNATTELDQVTLAMLDYKRLKKLCTRLHRGMRIKAAEVKGQQSTQRSVGNLLHFILFFFLMFLLGVLAWSFGGVHLCGTALPTCL